MVAIRRRRTVGSAFLFATLLAVAACGGGAGKTVQVGADASGTTVAVGVGDTVEITLDSNVTTGYRWNLVGTPDTAVLAVAPSQYVAPEDGRVGEGGVEVWRFDARAAGTTSLELSYFRPFDPKDVQGTFRLTVDVS